MKKIKIDASDNTPISFRCDPVLAKVLEMIMQKENISKTALIEEALLQLVKERGFKINRTSVSVSAEIELPKGYE